VDKTGLPPSIKNKPTNEEPKKARDSAAAASAAVAKDGNEGEWKDKRID